MAPNPSQLSPKVMVEKLGVPGTTIVYHLKNTTGLKIVKIAKVYPFNKSIKVILQKQT